MSQSNADLPLPRQFCRQWDERPVRIRFLSELTKRELASLERDYGERALASLPARLVQALGPRARRVRRNASAASGSSG